MGSEDVCVFVGTIAVVLGLGESFLEGEKGTAGGDGRMAKAEDGGVDVFSRRSLTKASMLMEHSRRPMRASHWTSSHLQAAAKVA